ncbi:MAG: hypothetical protein IPN76_21110 [Saprospiraceae bacterium]|jgi:hypothetical protein|nr:hypothetical protein [Saprospiraceae bacterium]
MKNPTTAFLFLLSIAYQTSCGVYSDATKPKVSKAGTGYRFEKVGQNSADPCAICVGFSATTRYERGNIPWNICSNPTNKGYLDLQLRKAARTIRLRLLRDCNDPTVVKVLRCVDESTGEFIINTNTINENSQVTIMDSGDPTAILSITIPASNQIGIQLKSGWTLDYSRQACSTGNN